MTLFDFDICKRVFAVVEHLRQATQTQRTAGKNCQRKIKISLGFLSHNLPHLGRRTLGRHAGHTLCEVFLLVLITLSHNNILLIK